MQGTTKEGTGDGELDHLSARERNQLRRSIHICKYIYIRMYTCMDIYVYIYLYTCVYAYVYMCAHVYELEDLSARERMGWL